PTGAHCDGEGQCVGPIMAGAPCDDGDEGTVGDMCRPDGGCYGQAVLEGCDDGNACNGEERLDPLVGCTPGAPPDCGDFCAGEAGICDPVTGCVSEEAPICDEADDCLVAECTEDGCFTEIVDCDDGCPCTIDFCVPPGDCVHEPAPDGLACDDGTACTQGESCQAGICGDGLPVTCDDCHLCDPESGQCSISLCSAGCNG